MKTQKIKISISLLISIFLLSLFTCNFAYAKTTPSQPREVVHFFTHALVNEKIAFNTDNPMAKAYDEDCLTPYEFKKILLSLYNNNYALVDIKSVYRINKNNLAVRRNFNFPHNKKPMILSFDDLNYYTKKMNHGMVDKLIISNGKIATYTKNAQNQIGYDNDVIPILENFIASHPDFSYNNARAMICLTGFDGILGYRTNRDSPNQTSEINAVKPIISWLKSNNYRFACHSYGHYHMKKISTEKMLSDTMKWKREVEPLVGKTDIYVYPYGEWEINIETQKSPKHQALLDSEFKLFCGVGDKPFYCMMPYTHPNNPMALFMDRIPLDGKSLRKKQDIYLNYFDSFEVYDHTHRTVKFNNTKNAI